MYYGEPDLDQVSDVTNFISGLSILILVFLEYKRIPEHTLKGHIYTK